MRSSCGSHVAARARRCPPPSAPRRRARCCSAMPISRASSRRSSTASGDLNVAAFAERVGGGFGLAKRVARSPDRRPRRVSRRASRCPASGRCLRLRAGACFPVAAGFGCEVRMTIDAARSRPAVREVELPLRPSRDRAATSRGFVHRARQLARHALRLRAARRQLPRPAPAARRLEGGRRRAARPSQRSRPSALADDLWSGPERGFRAHLAAAGRRASSSWSASQRSGLLATRRVSGALLVGLAANALNQLDTRPGRALKAYLAAAVPLDAPVGVAVLLLPYDLREMAMLGDAGSNALGALLGLNSVKRFTGRGQWVAIGALAGLTILGERTSIGAWIERTPGLAWLDRLGRS